MNVYDALNLPLMVKCPRCTRRNVIKDEICFVCRGTGQTMRLKTEMAEIITVLRGELNKKIWKQK
jgi:hypothetical protein